MIFWFVLYAFAVMGAAFAPPLILSLHWKRTTGCGVLCGMLAGVAVSVIWYNVPFLKAQLYEILPAAAASPSRQLPSASRTRGGADNRAPSVRFKTAYWRGASVFRAVFFA